MSYLKPGQEEEKTLTGIHRQADTMVIDINDNMYLGSYYMIDKVILGLLITYKYRLNIMSVIVELYLIYLQLKISMITKNQVWFKCPNSSMDLINQLQSTVKATYITNKCTRTSIIKISQRDLHQKEE